jgi:hypothetical protein
MFEARKSLLQGILFKLAHEGPGVRQAFWEEEEWVKRLELVDAIAQTKGKHPPQTSFRLAVEEVRARWKKAVKEWDPVFKRRQCVEGARFPNRAGGNDRLDEMLAETCWVTEKVDEGEVARCVSAFFRWLVCIRSR